MLAAVNGPVCDPAAIDSKKSRGAKQIFSTKDRVSDVSIPDITLDSNVGVDVENLVTSNDGAEPACVEEASTISHEPTDSRIDGAELAGMNEMITTSMKHNGEEQGNITPTNEVPEEIVTIMQTHPSRSYKVKLTVQGEVVNAVVDTAAEGTLISDRVFDQFKVKPPVIRNCKLATAGRELLMKAFVVGPVKIKLGDTLYHEVVYVAPIDDDMLLGFDFLKKHGARLDMRRNELEVGDKIIGLQLGEPLPEPRVARVSVDKRRVIPPNSVAKVKCKLSRELSTDYILQGEPSTKYLVPRSVHTNGSNTVACVMNITDNFIVMKKGMDLGTATEFDSEVMELSEEDEEVNVSEGTHSPCGNASTEGVDVNEAESSPCGKASVDAEILNIQEENSSPGGNIPDHIKLMVDNSKDHLSEEQVQELTECLMEFQDVFARDEFDLGDFTELEHEIDTGDAKPVKERARRTPACFVGEEESHLKKMLEAGVIQPSTSDWASAPVLIRKRDGSVRWCIDYRGLNAVTVKDVFPLPLIEDCMDSLAGKEWFSKLDANSAYWQIRIKESDRKKTAFTTKYGLFEHVKMGFGLCNAPATFSRVINLVMRGLNWKTALAFLDDILIMGRNFKDHLENLRQALERFRKYRLRLKPKKCIFFQTKVEFLGRIISKDSMEMSSEDCSAVSEWPVPKNAKDVERFLGLVNYHRSFVKNFAQIAVPLYRVTGKQEFQWGEAQAEAFEQLKKALVNPPVLALPNHRDDWILDTDASDNAIGAELLQVQNGEERVIAYASLALTAEQRRYCTTRKELLAIVRFTRQYRYYLLGRPFKVRTDHNSLIWLLRFKDPQGQLARWIEELSQYTMVLEYRKGKLHANADALSRAKDETCCEGFKPGIQLRDLPCGGCKHCTRADQQWSSFHQDVDDAVPLARGAETLKWAPWDPGIHSPEEEEDLPTVVAMLKANRVMVGEDEVEVNVCPVVTPDEGTCWGMNSDQLKTEQNKDTDLEIILTWLRDGATPSEGALFLASPAAKFYWINKERCLLMDDLLYCWNKEGTNPCLVVPSSMKQSALQMNHDIPMAGHQGVGRTKARMKEKFIWFQMSGEIEQYVLCCPACGQNKKSGRYGVHPMQEYHAGAPMERVHIDFLGPLPKTAAGNEHILMMVDQFTKWVEIIPLPSQTAEVTARTAVNEFFSRFGCPFYLFSDQGRNFESRLFTAMCDVLQIQKTRTTPYRPSANGQAERYNRTLMDAVRCFIGKKQNQWDIYLPQLAGAMRSSVNRHTGYTPNKLMLGREVNTPADIMFPSPNSGPDEGTDKYVKDLVQNMKEAHETARRTLKTSQKRMKTKYDLRVLQRSYQEGDVVYLLDTASVKGKCRKLLPP